MIEKDSFVYQEQDDKIAYGDEGKAEHYNPFGQPGFKDAAEILASRLPPWYPKNPGSTNYKLQGALGKELKTTGRGLVNVDKANTVQTAYSIPQLQRLASLVDIYHREGEDIETFRARIIYRFHLVTCRGTIDDLLSLAATILDAEKEAFRYEEQSIVENGVARLTVPPEKLDKLPFSAEQFGDILQGAVPAGYRLDVIAGGRFVYVSEDDYRNADYDPENGYAGLDSDGNPTRDYNGYSGLL